MDLQSGGSYNFIMHVGALSKFSVNTILKLFLGISLKLKF